MVFFWSQPFLTYKNGELVLTQDAVEDPYSSGTNAVCYTVDTENYDAAVISSLLTVN